MDDIFSKIDQFKKELSDSLETAVAERDAARAELADKTEEYSKKIEQLQDEHKRQMDAHIQESRSLVESLERKHADILIALDKGHRGLIDQHQQKQREQIVALSMEYEAKLEVARREFEERLAEQQKLESHQSEERLKSYEAQLEETNLRYREEITNLQERLEAGDKASLEELDNRHKTEIESLQQQLTVATENFQERLRAAIQEREEESQKKISEIQRQLESESQEQAKQHIEQLGALQSAHRVEQQQLTNRSQEILLEVQQETGTKIAALEKALAAHSDSQTLSAELARLTEELAAQTAKFQEADRLRQLEEKRNQPIKEALERATKEVESSQAELSTLHQEVGQLKEMLKANDKAPLVQAREQAKEAEHEVHRLEGLLVAQKCDLQLIQNEKLREEMRSLIESGNQKPSSQDVSSHEAQVLAALLKTELTQLLGHASELASENSKLRFSLKKFQEAPVVLPEGGSPQPVQSEKSEQHTDRELQRLAFEDKITGLPNIKLGYQYMAQSWGRSEKGEIALGLAHLDVQDLGLLNSNFGPAVGDEVLRQVGQLLSQSITGEDVVVRGEGDDFWVVATHPLGTASGIRGLADRLTSNLAKCIEKLQQPLSAHGNLLKVAVRAGITVAEKIAEKSVTQSQLQTQCRLALEAAKEKGPNQVVVYRPEMESPSRRNQEIAPLLEGAIQSQQLVIRFQPIYDLQSRKLWGSEALTRWDHPRHGLMDCKDFLDAAQESGLIVPMGQRMLMELIQCGSSLPRGCYVAINCCARELMQADFPRRITKVMENLRNIKPDQLVIEIPESDLSKPNQLLSETLRGLRRWNLALAVDDFTGSIAIPQMQRLKINFLKLHPDLLRRVETKAGREFLQSLVAMSNTWDCQLIAKHIENIAAVEHCLDAGIHLAQGYFLAKPVRVGDLDDLHTLQSIPLPQVPQNFVGREGGPKIPPRPKIR